MDESAALALVAQVVDHAGDDAAIVDDLVVTTDMLHESTDFPDGTTRYTAGWRAIGASLSDIAAMGARAVAAVAVYAAPTFEAHELDRFLAGAIDVCDRVDAAYVGGDLDTHQEFTVASTAIGRTESPVRRSGARPGDLVCVTGSLGRSAAAVRLFEDEPARANTLFQFTPRVQEGQILAEYATAMMDSSDGLARSLHQLASASDCGFALDGSAIPIADALAELDGDRTGREVAMTYGEDFELVVTLPPAAIDAVEAALSNLTVIGEVVPDGITIDGTPVPDSGYTHGSG